MTTPDVFTHQPLSDTSNQIRLLRILNDDPPGPIRCVLTTCDLDMSELYIALSYTWGPEHPQKAIEINGAKFHVRENLFDFLAVARTQYADQPLWIDQICIDQTNTAERNHQVSLMSQIYQEALCVVAWLGAEKDDSDIAISYLEGSPTDDHLELTHRHWSRSGHPREMMPREREALVALFRRSYWHRLWIIQEMVLPQVVLLLCGARQFLWLGVQSFVKKQHFKDATDIVSERIARLFLYLPDDEYYGYGDANGARARSFLLRPVEDEHRSVESFRALVYKYCDFECSDPRDKIYGLLGIRDSRVRTFEFRGPHQDGAASIDIDYSKPVSKVFWDFFVTHLDGIQLFRFNKINTAFALSMEEILADWWHYAMRLMVCMDLDSCSLRQDVASVLERTFQSLQHRWLSDGSLDADKRVDVSAFFTKKLQVADWTTSYSIPNRMFEWQ